jgi:predicted RNA methylase
MNPPFGTKYQDKLANTENSKFGIDMQFLKLAAKISSNTIYSLNKTVTRDYIQKFSSKLGLKMQVVSELRYNIPKVEKSNKKSHNSKPKSDIDIEVDFLRFEFI